MPVEWLSFNQNKRTVHLLDYPYLFNPSTLVTYFRAINYSRMNQSFELAQATGRLIYHTISEGSGSLLPEKHRRDRLYERLRTAASRFTVLEIRRDHVLLDTFNSIWRREERELMRPLKIRLGENGGEEGLDSGGVQQEFFRLAIAEALDADYGTFTIDARTKMTWFQPGSPEPLWKFELIGMVVSLAVYNGLTLPVTFPKALYRKLLDEEVTELHHIADGWPDLANGLTSLLEWDEKDGLVEDIFARTYEFSVEQFGTLVSREMGATTSWPQFHEMHSSTNPDDAPLVTNENRNSYVSDYIRWLTDISIRPQFEAFKKGFFACIDRRSISLFDPETLQSVVEGIQEIDISEMRRATRYIGWDASHKTIRDFWSIVKRYDIEQKRKLLEFVTASDRVPVGGMRNLQFTLQRNGVDDGHLPTSYTCYGILLLPEYSGKEVLREKLAMALENSKGFGFA
jgi:HECT-domain (ubiquitin-transferase)